jgi:hypothetical protein
MAIRKNDNAGRPRYLPSLRWFTMSPSIYDVLRKRVYLVPLNCDAVHPVPE